MENSLSRTVRRTADTSLEPRKTARQRRSEATVAAIVEAAARILETDGLEGYTTNAVARCAGTSIGSLYQYFPNKDAITLALIQREAGIVYQDLQDAVAMPCAASALERLIEVAATHQLRRPMLARLLDAEEARLPLPPERPNQAAAFHVVRSILMRIGLPDAVDLDIAAIDLVGLSRGITDGAGEMGESDRRALAGRVGRAVHGYLSPLFERPSA